jgi:hypothetical protein
MLGFRDSNLGERMTLSTGFMRSHVVCSGFLTVMGNSEGICQSY